MLSGMRLLARHSEAVYSLMRFATGFMFAVHGAQKLFGVLHGRQPAMGSQLWVGGVIELLAGSFIALGLFTRLSAFVASGTMAVAYAQFHWRFALDRDFFPIVNKGELALVYALVFLFIAAKGAGLWSLDRMLGRSGA
jgi:putative oxidoreductase